MSRAMLALASLVLLLLVPGCRRTEAPVGPSNVVDSARTAPAPASASALAPAPAPASASAPAPAPAPAAEAADAAAALVASGPPTDMLLVPAGAFTMGADRGGQEDEHPAHTVVLAAFWLDRTEVTNAQWNECVAAQACPPKSEVVRAAHPDFDGPNQPVSGVSWDDARGYCLWRGKRLPREAEFEKAVRGTEGRRFPWGDEPPTHERTVFSTSRPEDVGSHPAGRGPYGHDDLAGNVWEWMDDEYDPYAYRRPSAAEGRPAGCAEILVALEELRKNRRQGFTGTNPIPVECEHSIRGGAYNYDPDGLRATNRVHHPGRFQIPMLGLRCAKDSP
jgi:formylglycine-generating enzyme required for sulfatase activity